MPVMLLAGLVCMSSGPMVPSLDHDRETRACMSSIQTSLLAYSLGAGGYPSTEQGLQALVEHPQIEPLPVRWKQFLAEVPLDRWGHQFIYISLGIRNPKGFDLFSPGPDGVPNTKDDVWP